MKKIKRLVLLSALFVFVSLFSTKFNIMPSSYAITGEWYYNYDYVLDDEKNTITLSKYKGYETDLQVPSSVKISEKEYKVIVEGNVYQNNSGLKTVIFNEGVKAGQSLKNLFNGCSNLESVIFNDFDTSSVVDMTGMFKDCKKVKKLDLNGFNTTNLKYMDNIFYGMSNLIELDLSSFDTKNVEEIENSFNALSKISKISLGNKMDFKVGVLPKASNFSRGTWRRQSDNKDFSAVEIAVNSTSATGAAGVYEKISNTSYELDIDFPVDYKIGMISHIDEFKSIGNDNFYIGNNNKTIYTKIPLASDDKYSVPGSFEVLFKDIVEDISGNKFNLKVKVSNISFENLNVNDEVKEAKIEALTIERDSITFSQKFFDLVTNENISRSEVYRYQDVEIQIVDNDGNPQKGNYIFSIYDLDVWSNRDNSGYGDYSEGINIIEGLDTNDIKFASTTFLQTSTTKDNYKRITGTRSDNMSESSEFLVKANAEKIKFQWTAGVMCTTNILSYYQPQNVEIEKTNLDGKKVLDIGLELYKENNLFSKWKTTNESKKFFLNPGKYVLKEVDFPSYYNKAKDIVFFVDINDSLTINNQEVEKVVMVNDYKNSAGVIENHIDQYTGNILDNKTHNGKVFDEYVTKAQEFEGYKLVSTPTNYKGQMKEEKIEVNYYYKKIFNITTQVNGVGGQITGNETILEGDDSTPDKIVIKPNKNYVIDTIKINGVEIEVEDETGVVLNAFEDVREDKLVEVSFIQVLSNVPNTFESNSFMTTQIILLVLGFLFVSISLYIKKNNRSLYR